MENVPHWKWFMLLYFMLVALPVILAHFRLKKRVLAEKTPLNLLIYFGTITGIAFLMHIVCMYLYFKFIYGYKA